MAAEEYDEKNDPNSPNYAPDEDNLGGDEGFDDLEEKPKKPRKRRKWPWVILVLLVLLGVFVLVLPTIANLAAVRAFALEKINTQLNGQLEISDWSFGWNGNTELTGIRITQNGAQILAARRVFTELSLLDVVKGNWDLGTTVVEDLTFVFKQLPDGSNNFQKLPKWESSGEPVTLPDLRGDVDVVFWGSITQADGTLITLDRSHVNAKFESINGPIAHDLDVTARIGATSPGKLTAKGQVDLFENGQFDVKTLMADETTSLREFPLDAIAGLLPPGSPITTLKGLTSGDLKVKVQGANEVFVEGNVESEDFAIGGPAMAGDTFREKLVTVTIPETRYDRASGRLRTRQAGTQAQQIVLKTKQLGTIAVSANAPLPGLAKALANEAPGTDGRVTVNADLNLEAANQLPNLLPMPAGLRITSGVLHYDSELLLDKAAARVKGNLNVSELGGIDRNGRDVYAEPIYLAFNGTSLGGGGAIPDLRDLKVSLRSGFAGVQGGGESLSSVALTGTADLAKFRDQLGQFVELGLRQLAGQVVFNASANGDIVEPGGASAVAATVTATDVVVQKEGMEPVKEPWARLTAKGRLVRGEGQFVDSIDGAVVSAQTGNAEKPTVDFHASGDLEFPAAEETKSIAVASAAAVRAPKFETRMSIDVASAQREFGALLNPLRERGLTFTQGLVIASGAGAYDGATVKLGAFNAATQNVTLLRHVSNAQPVTVVEDYSATVDVAGAIRNDAGGFDARFSTLNWSDAKKMLSITESGDGDLVVRMMADGTRKVEGKVRLAADLKALGDVARALGDRPIEEAGAEDRAGRLRQGDLAGTLSFTPEGQGRTLVEGDVTVSRLGVTTYDDPIEDEEVTLSLRVRADDKLTSISAEEVSLESEFASVTVEETELRFAGASPGAYVSPLDVVQKASVSWDVTDLAHAVSVALAFVPESADGEEEEFEDEGVATARPGLEVESGSVTGSLRVDRSDEGIAFVVDELSGEDIVLRRGKGRFGPEELELELAALVRRNPAGTTPGTVMEQIREIRVEKLEGDVAVAEVALEEPIVIRDPGGMTQASGAVRIDGEVASLTDFLRTLEYLPSDAQDPFDGTYSVTQRLTTQQQVIGLSGQVNVEDFVAGRFRERLVSLVNDVQLDQKSKAMVVRNFTLNLEESRALSVKATGTIADYNDERRFENARALVSYDASKLPDLIRPLLDEASRKHIESLRLAGVVKDEPFLIEGKYPATPPASEEGKQRDPIQYVTARGRLAFEAFEYEGLPGRNLLIPLMLDNGRLTVASPTKEKRYPEPATFSRGKLDVGGLQVLLASNAIRFSSLRENHVVLDRVVVNRAIVERYLGQAHPLFTGADEARGVLTLTVNELDKLPIGEALTKPRRREEGTGKFTLALTDLRLKTFFLGQVLGTLKVVQVEPDGTVRTSIPEASFAIEGGVVNSNLGLNLGGTVLGFRDGSVRLRDNQILSLNMLIPKGLIPALRNEPLIKEFITVPVTGSLTRPQFDIIQAAVRSSGISNPLDLLKRLQQGDEGASGSDRIGTERPAPERRNAQEAPPQRAPQREQRKPRGTIGRQPR